MNGFKVGLGLGLLALLGSAAFAQDDQQAPAGDPPDQVARLSYAEGSVAMQPAGSPQWTGAEVNRPLTVGDQIWASQRSRAEIQLPGALLRLGDSSSVAVLNLSNQVTQLRVSAGTVVVNVRDLDPSQTFELDAPNAAVTLVQPGEYRVSVDSAGNTSVIARNGEAQVVGSSAQTVTVDGGQDGVFGANGAEDVAGAPPPDEFDSWCEQRDQQFAQAGPAAQYASSDAVGTDELGQYGDWNQDPEYGYVWYPTAVAYDWAPYRYGHWSWVGPWGWTWIDDAPWGFAPFHYGRWLFINQHWGWVPCSPRQRAVYAPALVAWVGAPAAGGPVGWVPLAPGEVYVPSYRVSGRYVQNINVSNTTINNVTYINNVYRNPGLQSRYANRGAPRALTVVSQEGFTSGTQVARHVVTPPRQWNNTALVARAPTIAPPPRAIMPNAPRVAAPPSNLIERPVLARRPPPPANSANSANASRTVVVTPREGFANPRQNGNEGRGIPERSPQFQPPAREPLRPDSLDTQRADALRQQDQQRQQQQRDDQQRQQQFQQDQQRQLQQRQDTQRQQQLQQDQQRQLQQRQDTQRQQDQQRQQQLQQDQQRQQEQRQEQQRAEEQQRQQQAQQEQLQRQQQAQQEQQQREQAQRQAEQEQQQRAAQERAQTQTRSTPSPQVEPKKEDRQPNQRRDDRQQPQ